MKSVAIVAAEEKDPDFRYRRAVGEFFREHGCEVCYGASADVSLIVVIGGDGSILHAARYAAPADIPILGVNLGRVGYMAELEVSELSLADKIFSDEYSTERRMMLSVSVIKKGGEVSASMTALNDAVISNGAVSRMVDIELFCDGSCVNRYRADGLIIATPTGSTAYSLAGGGAVVDPALDCICVTPVSSHLTNAKPIIFNAKTKLEVRDNKRTRGELYLTVDGSDNYKLEDGDSVCVTKSDTVTKLLKLKNNSFYDILNSRMS